MPKVIKITRYACDYCDKTFDNIDDAISCSNRRVIKTLVVIAENRPWEVGDAVIVIGDNWWSQAYGIITGEITVGHEIEPRIKIIGSDDEITSTSGIPVKVLGKAEKDIILEWAGRMKSRRDLEYFASLNHQKGYGSNPCNCPSCAASRMLKENESDTRE